MITPAEQWDRAVVALGRHFENCRRCRAYYALPSDPRITRCPVDLVLTERIDHWRRLDHQYQEAQARIAARERWRSSS